MIMQVYLEQWTCKYKDEEHEFYIARDRSSGNGVATESNVDRLREKCEELGYTLVSDQTEFW